MISYFSQAKHVIWAIIAVLVLFNEVAQAGDWPKWRGPSADAYVAKGDLLPNMLGNTRKSYGKSTLGQDIPL